MDYTKKWSIDWIYLNDIPCILIWSDQSINEWYIYINHDKLTIKSNEKNKPMEKVLYYLLMSNLQLIRESISFKFTILIEKIRAYRLCTRILQDNMSSFVHYSHPSIGLGTKSGIPIG